MLLNFERVGGADIGGCGSDDCVAAVDLESSSRVLKDETELDGRTTRLDAFSSPSPAPDLRLIADTRIPLEVTALVFTTVLSPTPTLSSHHASSTFTPAARGGHL